MILPYLAGVFQEILIEFFKLITFAANLLA